MSEGVFHRTSDFSCMKIENRMHCSCYDQWMTQLCPGPRWVSSRRSLRPLVGWGGGYTPHTYPWRTTYAHFTLYMHVSSLTTTINSTCSTSQSIKSRHFIMQYIEKCSVSQKTLIYCKNGCWTVIKYSPECTETHYFQMKDQKICWEGAQPPPHTPPSSCRPPNVFLQIGPCGDVNYSNPTRIRLSCEYWATTHQTLWSSSTCLL